CLLHPLAAGPTAGLSPPSLHDALPISVRRRCPRRRISYRSRSRVHRFWDRRKRPGFRISSGRAGGFSRRSWRFLSRSGGRDGSCKGIDLRSRSETKENPTEGRRQIFQAGRAKEVSHVMIVTVTGSAAPPSASFSPPPSCSAMRAAPLPNAGSDRKSTRLNSSHVKISYAVFCLKKKKKKKTI